MTTPDIAEKPAKWTRMQIQVLALAFALYLSDGIDNQILAVSLPALIQDWGRPSTDFSFPLAAGYAGAAIGAMMGGILGDRLGRKPVLVGAAFLVGICTLLMALAADPFQMGFLRAVAGFGFGGCLPVTLAMVTECVQPSRKGLVVAFALACPAVGISASGLLATVVIPAFGWQGLFVVGGALPLLIGCLMVPFLPESPAFLARNPANAERVSRIAAALGIDEPAAAPAKDRKGKPGGYAVLLRPDTIWIVVGLAMSFFLTYLAIALILGWLPTLLFQQGFPLNVSSLSPSVWSVTGIFGMLGVGVVIGIWGARRVATFVIVAATAATALLALVAPDPDDISRLDLVLYFVVLGLSGLMMNSIMAALYAFAAGTFPADSRATSLGFSATIGRGGAVCGAFVGGYLVTLDIFAGFFLAVAGLLLLVAMFFNLGGLTLLRGRPKEARQT